MPYNFEKRPFESREPVKNSKSQYSKYQRPSLSLITRNWLDFFSENLKKSFCYDGGKLWNSLPADMRDSLPPPQALFRANLGPFLET
jgi:hypothetical protein